MMLRPGAIVFTRSAVNRRLTDSGSERKTTSPGPRSRALKVSPSSRRQCSKNGSGRKMKRAVCSGFESGIAGTESAGSAGAPSELGNGGVDHPTAIVSIAGVTASLADLDLVASGKVREMYADGDEILMVASDRISAYDVVLPTAIPDKGKVLTQMSVFWFETTGQIVPNH